MQVSDNLLVHLVKSVNKLVTQHAIDMVKLEYTRKEDIKKLKGEIMQHKEELKRVNAENSRLQEDISKINIRQKELENKLHSDIKEINSKYVVA